MDKDTPDMEQFAENMKAYTEKFQKLATDFLSGAAKRAILPLQTRTLSTCRRHDGNDQSILPNIRSKLSKNRSISGKTI